MEMFTGSGDRGMTSLKRDRNVSKSDDRIQAIGEIEDLITHVGMIKLHADDASLKADLEKIQRNLLICIEGIHDPYHKDNKIKEEDIKKIYEGHEVAAHTICHPCLTYLNDWAVIKEVEEDRLYLSDLVGYEVIGMAYPGGNGPLYDSRVSNLIKEKTGIKYARTTTSTHNFDLQDNLFEFKPSVYHHKNWDKMFELAEKFVNLKPEKPQIFYIWGHAYEFDIHNTWDRFEQFCAMISGRDDIFYGTNAQVLLNR